MTLSTSLKFPSLAQHSIYLKQISWSSVWGRTLHKKKRSPSLVPFYSRIVMILLESIFDEYWIAISATSQPFCLLVLRSYSRQVKVSSSFRRPKNSIITSLEIAWELSITLLQSSTLVLFQRALVYSPTCSHIFPIRSLSKWVNRLSWKMPSATLGALMRLISRSLVWR